MPIPPFIKSLRKKIGHDPLFLPGVWALVIQENHDRRDILLHRRADTGGWAVLGGLPEPGEHPADAVVREVYEESGVTVEPIRVAGVYSTPLLTFPNGDQCHYIITTFVCRPISGEPKVNDDESLEVRYFPLEDLPPLNEAHRSRIEHALQDKPGAFFQVQGNWRFGQDIPAG